MGGMKQDSKRYHPAQVGSQGQPARVCAEQAGIHLLGALQGWALAGGSRRRSEGGGCSGGGPNGLYGRVRAQLRRARP